MAKSKPEAEKIEDPAGKRHVESILEIMREGESLRKSCKAFGVAPSSFIRWVDEDKDLSEQYAQARARMLDAQAEALEELGEKAASAETAVEVAGLRLQSDNRKWLLSKLAPKKYGDKLQLGGADDLPPVQSTLNVSGLSTQTLAEIMSARDAAKAG